MGRWPGDLFSDWHLEPKIRNPGYNDFGDAGTKAMCEALAANPECRIQLLGLRHCRLGDGAADSVVFWANRSDHIQPNEDLDRCFPKQCLHYGVLTFLV